MAQTMSGLSDPAEKFYYQGPISSSKSIYNRALIVKSFFPDLILKAASSCEDVKKMIAAVNNLKTEIDLDCGEAGTVLRFLALRASREEGLFRLKGKTRLFERPQKELLSIFKQLSVKAEFFPNELVIESQGWKKPSQPLEINRESSSQFSTGVLMSAWNLDFPLEFQLKPSGVNDAYWNMSLSFAEQLGMKVAQNEKELFFISSGQVLNTREIAIEPDYSSAFAIAATAAISGEAHLSEIGYTSLQPDYAFIDILKSMGVSILLEKNILSIYQTAKILPIQLEVSKTPDLFPVLAILCAFSAGESRLTGAPRLAHKESHRINKTSELLSLMGVKNKPTKDGIIIFGKAEKLMPTAFDFDPDQDHRMAMAAGVLMRAGWKINLKTPEVVKKSFPEFWQILGINPHRLNPKNIIASGTHS